MDKLDVFKYLKLANDLWAIEGTNPYSIRAHDKAADAILTSEYEIEEILNLAPGTIPGVGKETLAMVQALQTAGLQGLLQRLNITIPKEAAELLRLPGIGPKTAHALVHQYHIHSASELQEELEHNRLQHIPGLGPSRLARLRRDLRVYLERQQLLPVAFAWPFAKELQAIIQQIPGVHKVSITGPIRRLVVMSHRIETVVAVFDKEPLLQWSRQWRQSKQLEKQESLLTESAILEPRTEQIHLDSTPEIIKLSIPTSQSNPVPVRLYLTTPENYACVLMETTGDETHQEVMKGLLLQKSVDWTPSGLIGKDRTPIPAASETEIYSLVGLPYLPPEVREGQGLLCKPAQLIERTDIRGDLHVHSTWSDGSLSISQIAEAAEQLGYEYIAITDHSQSLSIARGLTPERIHKQRTELEEVRNKSKVKILHGTEVDILADGKLDLPDEILFELDFVIASTHSAMHQTKEQMTNRILRAIHHPAVHAIGHLSGRILGRRAPYELDAKHLLNEAAACGVMFELNANPNRLDISEELLRDTKAKGMLVPINTDTHHMNEFDNMEYGVRMAKRGWLYKENVLNTLPFAQLMRVLRRRRN